MAGLTKTLEIALVGSSLELIYTDHTGVKLPAEYFPVCGIKSIKGVPQIGHGTRDATNQRKNPYPFDDMLKVEIEMDQKSSNISFDIQSVTNQAGWTPNLAGLVQAITDINGWAGECGCCADMAIALDTVNANLVSILNAIQDHQDMELILVKDTGNGDLVVKQINEYDETTGAWTISYQTMAGAVYVPVGPLVYMDVSAILSNILTQVTNINNQFTGAVTSVTKVNISGNAAYVIPAGYHAWQLIVTAGTVTDGIVIYPAGAWSEEGPLLKTLPAGTTLNATGATAYIKLMTI